MTPRLRRIWRMVRREWGKPAVVKHPGLPEHLVSHEAAQPIDHIRAVQNMMWAREVASLMLSLLLAHKNGEPHDCEMYCIPVQLGEVFEQLDREGALTVLLAVLKSTEVVEVDAD